LISLGYEHGLSRMILPPQLRDDGKS